MCMKQEIEESVYVTVMNIMALISYARTCVKVCVEDNTK